MQPALLTQISPTTRFLLTSVCACEGGEPQPDRSVTGAALAAEASFQQVAGLALRWAADRPDDPVAASLASELGSAGAVDAVARGLLLAAETSRFAAILRDGGIRVLAVKGALLSKIYYGDFSLRHPGDVDLQVAPEDAGKADRLLREAGCIRSKPARELTTARQDLYLRTQHEFGYRNNNGSVELHWRFADPPELASYTFDDLWQRSQVHDVAGQPVHALSNRDTFVHLAIHGALDGWSRLKWIADLPHVLATLGPDDVEGLLSEARRMGHERILVLALALAGRPAGERAWMADALPRIVRRLSGKTPEGMPEKIAAYLEDRRYRAAIADDSRMRRAMAYASLIMPADFDKLDLPDAMTPALPLLAQCRRAVVHLAGSS